MVWLAYIALGLVAGLMSGLIGIVDGRNHDPVGGGVQRLTNDAGLVSCNADNRRNADEVARTHSGQNIVIVQHPVLAVYPDPIPVTADTFDGPGARIHHIHSKPALLNKQSTQRLDLMFTHLTKTFLSYRLSLTTQNTSATHTAIVIHTM